MSDARSRILCPQNVSRSVVLEPQQTPSLCYPTGVSTTFRAVWNASKNHALYERPLRALRRLLAGPVLGLFHVLLVLELASSVSAVSIAAEVVVIVTSAGSTFSSIQLYSLFYKWQSHNCYPRAFRCVTSVTTAVAPS